MKQYNWITKLGKSLVPSEFYIHILQESMGKAIGYMLIFIALLSILVGGYSAYQMNTGLTATISDYESGLIPAISLVDGNLKVEGSDTVTINHFPATLVFDDENVYDINDVLAYDNFILFGDTAFTIMSKGIGPISYQYRDMFMVDLTSEDLLSIFKLTRAVNWPVTIITQFLISVVSFFFNSIFILIMANISRTFLGLGLRLKQLYHMTIYAMTFSVFWSHFTMILPKTVPALLDTFVYYIIPSLILLDIFVMIRKRAIEEFKKRGRK